MSDEILSNNTGIGNAEAGNTAVSDTEAGNTAISNAGVDNAAASTSEESRPEEPEIIPSMDDFKDEIAHSFRKIKVGDIVNGTVIGVSDSEVTVDLNSYSEGIIPI